MASPRFEVLSGTIDGVNTVFTVSVPYKPVTSAVFLNGALMRIDLVDGWTESDPSIGEITFNEAPRSGPSGGNIDDVLQMFFLDTSPASLDTTIVERICGTIEAADELEGRLFTSNPICGTIEVCG